MKKLVYLFVVLALVLALAPFSISAQEDPAATRPSPASPDLDLGDSGGAAESAVIQSESISTLLSEDACSGVFQTGADRLVGLQNNDGGWDWPLDDGNPDSTSPLNTVGPIAMGLAHAYAHTGDAAHRIALIGAGALLLSKTNNFSPSDGYLAAQLDATFGLI